MNLAEKERRTRQSKEEEPSKLGSLINFNFNAEREGEHFPSALFFPQRVSVHFIVERNAEI